MRITRDTLIKNMNTLITQRIRSDRSLVAIYQCGSLLGEDYMIGGAADIDLVFIHSDFSGPEREFVRLTDDVTIDIAHHLHRDYRQTRKLRVHPWLGPTIFRCQILHDPQHFMDFTQASVRGQFFRADYVMQRARVQAERSRQIWMAYASELPAPQPDVIQAYLRAVEHAANAVASLNGHPLTERRMLVDFPARAQAAGRPGLYPGLLGLLGARQVEAQVIKDWLPAWEAAFDAQTTGQEPARLNPERKNYYLKAIEWFVKSQQPEIALWPLQRTWTEAVARLPLPSEHTRQWREAFEQLGLASEAFSERVAALDAYLDLVEETLDDWALRIGAQI